MYVTIRIQYTHTYTHTQRQYSEDNVVRTKENKETIVINHLETEVKGRAGDSEEIHTVADGGKRKHTYIQQNDYTGISDNMQNSTLYIIEQ